jgi:hypothetical protein
VLVLFEVSVSFFLFLFSFFGTRKAEPDCIKRKRKLQIQPRKGEGGEAKVQSQKRLSVSFFNPTVHDMNSGYYLSVTICSHLVLRIDLIRTLTMNLGTPLN